MYLFGPIGPPSNQKSHILVCMDYLIKWVEVKALRVANEIVVIEFLNENIFTGFGVPREIVTDEGMQFNSKLV